MGGLPGSLVKTLFFSNILVITGCVSGGGNIMSAENLRAALDECLELKL